jgi:hypothetical protein
VAEKQKKSLKTLLKNARRKVEKNTILKQNPTKIPVESMYRSLSLFFCILHFEFVSTSNKIPSKFLKSVFGVFHISYPPEKNSKKYL